MTSLVNNRWIPSPTDFAVRVEVSDLDGFFSKQLTVEPGVVAFVLENGQSVGTVPSGLYTLESFSQRLAFWSKRPISAILARENPVYLELSCGDLPTREMLLVDVRVRVGIQVDDIALFQRNLLGARAVVSLADLEGMLAPMARQVLWEAIGRLSIRDLTSRQSRVDLELAMTQAFGASLLRAGLKFVEVQTLSVSHHEYDAQRRRVGELWLQREGMQLDEQQAQAAADQRLAEIRGQERVNELDILAQQVDADRMEGELAARNRRIGIRKALREAILAGKFDAENAADQLAAFRQQHDSQRAVREDEYQTLLETLRDRRADRGAQRQQLLRRLEIEQQAELGSLRVQLDFAQTSRTRMAEIELAKINDDEAARRWLRQLQQEAEAAAHQRDERLKRVEADRQAALRTAQDQRDEALRDIVGRQDVDRVAGEIQIAQAQRSQRLAITELEVRTAQQQAEIALRDRRAASERELQRNQGLDQLERVRLLQEMNVNFQRQESELRIHEKRTEAELAMLRDDKAATREIARLQALRGLSDLELVAGSSNSGMLVDLLKHRATQQTAQEVARHEATVALTQDAAMQALCQRLEQAESQAAHNLVNQKQRDTDQTIALMREMLLNQQDAFGKFGTNLENVTRNLGPHHPFPAPASVVVVPAAAGAPPASSQPAGAPGGVTGGSPADPASVRAANVPPANPASNPSSVAAESSPRHG